MPSVVATFECVLCGDIFEATSGKDTECKCGKNSVNPKEYSTSYWSNEGRGKNFKRLSSKTFYSADEYIELDEECMRLWDKIKNFKFTNYSHFYWANAGKDKSADGSEYIYSLRADVNKMNKYDEQDELKFEVQLKVENYNDRPDMKTIKDKLRKFYKTLIRIKYGKININDRDFMEKNTRSWYRKQQEKYDYEFWF